MFLYTLHFFKPGEFPRIWMRQAGQLVHSESVRLRSRRNSSGTPNGDRKRYILPGLQSWRSPKKL